MMFQHHRWILAGAAGALLACLSVAAAPQTPAPPAGAQPASPPRPGILVAPGGRGGSGIYEAPAADDPANADADLSPKPPVLPLSPAEQARQFWLPPGYHLEPVLSDPVIQEPAQIAFDGNGRMFVVELRGYEQTPDGVDVMPPLGRISRHEDRDNDGVFDHHTVFVDRLIFPRFVMPWGAGSILTLETNADDVWKYTDTNSDGVADRRDLFASDFGRGGNLEHQPSSLVWGMDNWLYSTVNSFRLRWTPDGRSREPTGPNLAQWGATQDNHGKMYFQGGASGLPSYFQFPIHYGSFPVSDQLEPGLNVTWGAPILIGDIQAGLPGTRLPDGSLILATAGAGNDVYRGDRLPADLVGDYLYGEAVGRVVRRLKPVKTGGLTQFRNAYPRSEFIRSIDPLFRPVEMATAPDGTLYIVDMYRGVMEGAPWAKQGTYLRQKIDQYQLDKIVGRGRIWRLTHDRAERDRTRPRMLDEAAAQLVRHLAHPNGWWRDTAQQLLVLKQDRSVVPALQQMARSASNPLARAHALWTLEGLGALDAPLLRSVLGDRDPTLRVHAIRASETLYKAGDTSFGREYRSLTTDPDPDVAIQAMLTLGLFKPPDLPVVVQAAQAANPARGVQEVGRRLLLPTASLTFGGRGAGNLTATQQATLQRGAAVYNELCATCHGPDGRGTAVEGRPGATLAPPLITSTRVQGHRDYVVLTLLHGLSGPIDGRTYSDMVPMGTNTDEWIASVASYVRSGFGSGWLVTPADVTRARAATTARKAPFSSAELQASLPRPLAPDTGWIATSSHNSSEAARGLNFAGWTTGARQAPGMWFQVELPSPVRLTEIQFESPTQPGTRGGPPPAPTYAPGYRLEVSSDGRSWISAIARGEGSGVTTVATFPPVLARHVRITLTDAADAAPFWSIQALRLFQAPGPSASAP